MITTPVSASTPLNQMPKIYLGGPIHGLTHEESSGWRDYVTPLLNPLICLSPLRDFDTCLNSDAPYEDKFQRDYEDVMTTCQAAFFYVLNAKKPSIGTICEIAWSYTKSLPIALIIQEGNPNWNDFLVECVSSNPNGRIFDSIHEGINFLRQTFGLPEYAD